MAEKNRDRIIAIGNATDATLELIQCVELGRATWNESATGLTGWRRQYLSRARAYAAAVNNLARRR